ncbi:MAG: radical SAM protein [Kiritimatiellae bacterium]|nr:radical SAM protein [Kiritimatiellia bacterium]
MGRIVLCTQSAVVPHKDIRAGTTLATRVLASYLLGHLPVDSWQVSVVDFLSDESINTMAESVLAHDPDVVGLSCYVWNYNTLYALADRIVELAPGVVVVLGGPQMSYDDEDLARLRADHPGMGLIIQGEGERALATYLQMPRAGRPPAGHAMRGPNIERLEEIGGPLFANFPPGPEVNSITCETMRGCPFRCAFCNWNGYSHKLRRASPAMIEAELRWAVERSFVEVGLLNAAINIDKRHLHDIVAATAAADPGRTIKYYVEGDYHLFTPDQVKELARMRVATVGLGVQSAGRLANRLSRRKLDREALRRTVKLLIDAGLHPSLEFMAGLPGDSLDDIRRTFDFAFSLRAEVVLNVLRILPGSEFYTRRKELGLIYDEAHGHQLISNPWLSESDLVSAIDDFRSRSNGETRSYLWEIDGTMSRFGLKIISEAAPAPAGHEVMAASLTQQTEHLLCVLCARCSDLESAAPLQAQAERMLRRFPGLRLESSEVLRWNHDVVVVCRLLLPNSERIVLCFTGDGARGNGVFRLPGCKVLLMLDGRDAPSQTVQLALQTLGRWAQKEGRCGTHNSTLGRPRRRG